MVKRTSACVLVCALWSVLGIVMLISKNSDVNLANATEGARSAIMAPVTGCGCTRLIAVSSEDTGGDANFTTCSPEAHMRGSGQKVVAYAFYEPPKKTRQTKEVYFQGIKTNLELMKRFYPGWIMRLYFEARTNMVDLCDLACSESNLDLCDVEQNPQFGNVSFIFPMVWRFLPVLDPQVEAILCRDLDSHITPREVAAVEEFFSYPELTFHTMRDHPAHTAPVMGGMWGAKVERDRQKWIESFRAMYKNGLLRRTRKNKGTDQEALRRFVWPWAQRQSLAHDAYFCTSFPGRARPFPTRRAEGVGNFVGGVFDLNATLRFDDERNVCPEVCRKRPDWTFC